MLAGQIDGKMAATPLADVAGKRKPFPKDLFDLAAVLAR
jgi:hypothetical protein